MKGSGSKHSYHYSCIDFSDYFSNYRHLLWRKRHSSGENGPTFGFLYFHSQGWFFQPCTSYCYSQRRFWSLKSWTYLFERFGSRHERYFSNHPIFCFPFHEISWCQWFFLISCQPHWHKVWILWFSACRSDWRSSSQWNWLRLFLDCWICLLSHWELAKRHFRLLFYSSWICCCCLESLWRGRGA